MTAAARTSAPPAAPARPLRAPELDEAELVAAFTADLLSPEGFDHRQHLRLGWALLRRRPLPEVLARFRRGLEGIAAAAGKPDLYHETITWLYLLLLNARMEELGRDVGWDELLAASPDLAGRPSELLGRYYREDTLGGALARRVFVLPDRV